MIQSYAGFWSPSVDLYETADMLVMYVELPGMNLEELELLAHRRSIVVKGIRKPTRTGLSAERLEIRTGRFEREIQLPCRIDLERITASMREGVLCIEMPRSSEEPVGIRVDGETPDD